ncbi:MAG: amidohydrolase [Crocinitomicaceae bacterium]|jgi:amidohydrolase|nr:amidohydrolase [Crocinitomicaceae bacterium]MBT6514505.1 amidohydrolase [Crocinitomicaceae bacterium]
MIAKIKALAKEYNDEVIQIRRHIHQHPELSFKEFETSKFIQKQLTSWGVEFDTGYVNTGIIAFVKGKNPSSKVIALRADIDALPIQEENEFNFASINKGVMHACGHDVHTSSLLGAIKILQSLKSEFNGTVKCLFQPAEEILPGGASLMIEQGALENPKPDSILGQHVYPELPVGKVGMKSGLYMASTDELYVKVIGKGGHAALPHTVIDPVLITSHIIVALQQIVSRSSKPDMPSVLSFGKVIAEGATNIIPEEVNLAGTFRTFDESWRSKAHEKMIKMASSIAESMGGSCEFEVRKGYPYLVNDEAVTAQTKKSAIAYLGKENVVDLDLRMTAEDFAYYSQIMPGCFYRLGTATPGMQTSGLHTSTFNPDERAIEQGMGLMSWLAIEQLNLD